MMNEVQEYARSGPRLPPLLARHKALPDLCPAAETNTAHTPQKDDDGPPAPPVVVRGGACAAATGSGALSPTASPGAAPTFPAVPTLVGGKYLLTRPLDHSACHATHLHTQQSLLVKTLEGRAAHDLVAHHALMAGCEGVRAPIEMVVSACRRRAWVVFPAHHGDLHSHVRVRRRLREAEAQRLFTKVAATVAECHEAGLVLRDLKLRKFVFTDSDRQQVCLESLEDSVLVGDEDWLQDKHGCPAYVAPEILTSSSYSGRAADMWGLGVMLYTMLVGRYPFHDSDTSSLFAKIRCGEFKVPEWVSSRARHLITALLRRDPARRLAVQDVLSHPWLTRPPRDHPLRDPTDHTVPTMFLQSPSHRSQSPKASSTTATHTPSLFGL
ncbi:tribbles homolog 2-like [Penaeus japonicus]|uniref:tribbles homolog 2-like n=1 Tax=Penaeus japonicus TaxID=27405 RepID=UPI001C71635D|nr:tribbles homolog 2-like [Penaeus japonicus]XP_042866760.1 tribbles homolog 2-like [Penaeus japonicus]XP_042866761.1 tribbles homolog 2-like [Penaeus japonicus]